MDIVKNVVKSSLMMLVLVSPDLHAREILEQTIVFNSQKAAMNPAVPFTVECPTCIDLVKKNDWTYTLKLTALTDETPEDPMGAPFDDGVIAFSYYFGELDNGCFYNAKTYVVVTVGGRMMGTAIAGDSYGDATLDTKSSQTSCPPIVHFRIEDTSMTKSTIYLE